MRALFLAPSAYPLGGLATWLDTLLPALERSGWEVTLGLTAGIHHDTGRYLGMHPWQRVSTIANPTGSREGRVLALALAVERSGTELVVVVNTPDAIDAVQRLRARGSDLRVALTVHGIEEETIDEARRCCDVVDAVVCTNRLACALVEGRSGLEARRVGYAPYGVEVPSALLADVFRGTPLRLLYAGRLEQKQKRVFDLPPILQALDEAQVPWNLTVAGNGPDGAELERRLETAGVRDRVDLLGDVPRQAVLGDLLRRTDALLLTSSWETGPIVVWEAMAAGVPVVSSRYLGSGREGSLVDGENCLLFEVGDARAAAHCVRALLRPETRQRVRAAGITLVGERYSIAASTAAWHRVLRGTMELPPRPAPPPAPAPPAGRLDRWLGVGTAERLRRAIGRRFEHSEPGGEWPHTYSLNVDADQFWREAAALDHRRADAVLEEAPAAAAPGAG